MKTKLKKQPVWVDRALQGVTHWMGHRRCLYRGYPLSEGAEVCNLIYANLPEALSTPMRGSVLRHLRRQPDTKITARQKKSRPRGRSKIGAKRSRTDTEIYH